MENTLYNSDLVWQLCTNHDDGLTDGNKPDDVGADLRELMVTLLLYNLTSLYYKGCEAFSKFTSC